MFLHVGFVVAFVYFLLNSNASEPQIHRTQRKTNPRVAEPLTSYATFLGRSCLDIFGQTI